MNIFGLIAVIAVCATTVAITELVCKRGITVRKVFENKAAPVQTPVCEKPVQDVLNKEERISMDTVIAAANQLMGIELVSEQKEDK